MTPFAAFQEQMNFDDILEQERTKASTMNMRSKKLLLMNQLDQK